MRSKGKHTSLHRHFQNTALSRSPFFLPPDFFLGAILALRRVSGGGGDELKDLKNIHVYISMKKTTTRSFQFSAGLPFKDVSKFRVQYTRFEI